MNNTRCPVCGSLQSQNPLCEVRGFEIFKCGRCSADHVFPMPSEATLKAYYDRADWFEAGEAGGYKNYDEETAWSVQAVKPIFEAFASRPDLSVLDVGCGYGSHLALAASMGWKCFGVEVSDHARQVAQQRLAESAFITQSVDDLIPHAFDLILMLDVIEHLPSPYAVFYSLFSIGAITPETVVVIATPNAESFEARNDPANWAYRHPPSHLVYYTSATLKTLLRKLQFTQIEVTGTHPGAQAQPDSLGGYAGLMVRASGSNFTEFMRERYVPGTWSKIAEYEHLPRYALARKYVAQKSVLDFGCGSGYGASLMAKVAHNVTGLDIDATAISWARDTHQQGNLNFHRCDDLGQSLSANTFDVVTCFEMIEHVDYATQQATVASIARLLKAEGFLVISTPNPEITKLYGANPYHLREMSLGEFSELLSPHFPHIQIFEQRVRNSIAFDLVGTGATSSYDLAASGPPDVIPLAFIAVCSKVPASAVNPLVVFDEEVDTIQDYLSKVGKINAANFERYRLGERVAGQTLEIAARHAHELAQEDQINALHAHSNALQAHSDALQAHSDALQAQIEALGLQIGNLREDVADHAAEIQRLQGVVHTLETIVSDQVAQIHVLNIELQAIYGSLWHRLGVAIKARPISLRSIGAVLRLTALVAMPLRMRNALRAAFSRSGDTDGNGNAQ